MDFLILRPLPPKTGYHFFEGGWGGGGQKFLLNRQKAVGTHGNDNRASGPMVTQPTLDVQASIPILVCRLLARPPGAALQLAAGVRTCDHMDAGRLRYHLATTVAKGLSAAWGHICHCKKNPNCVYLSDCLLAGSGTDWLTVNLSSRCTAEGNRIF